MTTLADADHDKAERIMRKVFGIDQRAWPNALCGLIEKAIADARIEGALAMSQALTMHGLT